MILGAVLAPIAAACGYFAVSLGVIPLPGSASEKPATDAAEHVAFVPVDPMIISIGRGGESRHLRFHAQLEVTPAHAPEVQTLMPRVVDVLNGYLRAVDIRDLEDTAALIRLRAQMLRRVQIVTGEGRVKDLLIMEFVLS
jgi:flagellar FliL protein